MNNEILTEVLDKINNIPPMPSVVMKILALLRNPSANIRDIVSVVRLDEKLTFQVLKLANSAHYNRTQQRVSSIDEALIRLGNNTLINIVLAKSCSGYFSGAGEGYDLRQGELWRHSIACALMSQRLADRTGFQQRELLFTTCMLHDVGKVILDAFITKKRGEIQTALDKEHVTFTRAEMDVLGISHSEIGARLLEKWNFPLEIISAVRYHHEPERAVNAKKLAYHVSLSDLLCLMLGIGLGLGGLSYESQAEVFNMFQLTEADVQRLFVTLLEELRHADELLKT
ncbi:MAG: HDOD domain-containing protein [Fibrobacterota bacterium]